MRELRQGLAVVVDQVAHGDAVFAGAHRKPEVVLMSLDQYEQLTAVRARGGVGRVLDGHGGHACQRGRS